jgi:hypothetical protein
MRFMADNIQLDLLLHLMTRKTTDLVNNDVLLMPVFPLYALQPLMLGIHCLGSLRWST